jgi:pilus assembly protein FimV
MNLRKIAVQLLIMLNFVSAVHAADFQQVQLRGPKDSAPQFSGVVYGPVVPTDTLWQISRGYRPDNTISIRQVMLAIYELNPDAFSQKNLNLLKSGAMLKMPSNRYIARVDPQQSQQKSERDSLNWQSSKESPKAPVNKPESQASKVSLDQTNQLIEQKFGAIDEAHNRQFMAIRKQFAESINGVQNIFDENQKLFERLDKVNDDIDEMRTQEEEKSQQLNQMGESIEELLERARQEEADKAAKMQQESSSWLYEPIYIILLSILPVILLLAGFAYWLVRRKDSADQTSIDLEIDDEIILDKHTVEMDDLSDAISAELSNEVIDELDDDNLFGDDDLLDDVLSDELEESLDEVLADDIDDENISDFDDLDDDVLEDDFDMGAEVVEQEDLDSLFGDDDDLLAPVDEELSAELSQGSTDDGLFVDEIIDVELADEQTNESSAEFIIEDDEPEIANDEFDLTDIESDLDELLTANDDPTEKAVITPLTLEVEEDEEQPEISIDDLLDAASTTDPIVENILLDDSEEINEDVLQNLDKEIASQNDKLDSVTGTLLDELEQVEQMRDMLPDEDESTEIVEPQLGIQTLDDLAEDIDDELLADEDDNPPEIDISEILQETPTEIIEQDRLEVDEVNQDSAVLKSEEENTSGDMFEQSGIQSIDQAFTEDDVNLANVDNKADETSLAEVEVEVEVEAKAEAEAEAKAAAEAALEAEQELELEPELELNSNSKADEHIEFEELQGNDLTLDEDQLEKALEDFEKEELEEVLEDLTSNESASIGSLDDLELSSIGDNFVDANSSTSLDNTSLPDLDADFGDSALDEALGVFSEDADSDIIQDDNDELDDLPGLGEWLAETDTDNTAKADLASNEDIQVLDELSESSFDEMLESIDLEDESESNADETGFDFAAMLEEQVEDESTESLDADIQTTEDFLDVDSLLNDSIDSDSEAQLEKDFDLDMTLEPFVNEQDNLAMIDVDADDGLGAKLDLAHAYIEIGEEESAKELLDEIIDKGDAHQIEQAKELLDKL